MSEGMPPPPATPSSSWAALSAGQKWALVPYALLALAFIRGVAAFAEAYPRLCHPLAGVLGASSLVLGALFAGAHLLLRDRLPPRGSLGLFGLLLLGAVFITSFALPFNLALLGALGEGEVTTTLAGVEVELPWLERIALGVFWVLIFGLDLVVVAAGAGVVVAFLQLLVVWPGAPKT